MIDNLWCDSSNFRPFSSGKFPLRGFSAILEISSSLGKGFLTLGKSENRNTDARKHSSTPTCVH